VRSTALPGEATQLGLDLRFLFVEAVRVVVIRAEAPDAVGEADEHAAIIANRPPSRRSRAHGRFHIGRLQDR